MIGHEPLIKMRINNVIPTIVFLGDFQDPAAKDWHNPGEKYNAKWPKDHVTICIAPDEPIEDLELRFLVDMRVSISATTEERAKELFQAAIDANAKTVAAAHILFSGPFESVSTGWSDIYQRQEE